MTSLRPLLSIFLAGCAAVHEPAPIPVDPPAAMPTSRVPFPSASTRVVRPTLTPTDLMPPAALETCLGEGGQLREMAAVDNDDTEEHGDLLTLAVDVDGRIAVAAADGVIKLWDFEQGFLGALTVSQFLYGAETTSAPANDMLFDGERVVVGDVRGLVSSWMLDPAWSDVIGGTDPDIAITAVAIDGARRRLAHADVREGGHVMIRALEGIEVIGPLTSFATVRDLAFLSDGSLLIAGGGLERRAAADPARVDASFTPDGPSALAQVAVVDGTVATVGDGVLAVLDELLAPRWIGEAPGGVSVALSPTGRYVFVVLADGSLRAFDAADGRALGSIDVVDPVVVRMQPNGAAVIVGSRDGGVRAFGCAP